MLFIVMHKSDPKMEAGGPPDQSIVTRMGAFIGEAIRAGQFQDGAGLRPSSNRVRLTYKGGKRSTQRGPYAGSNELITGLTMLKVNSMDDAVHWADRYAEALGDVEFELGQVVEPWDIGVAPKPTGPVPVRVLMLPKATADYEAGQAPRPEVAAKLTALTDAMKQAGVFVSSAELKPSAGAARLSMVQGKRKWTDGPFAESKELVAGFGIIKLGSRQEAIEWANRYADILVDNEVDVREVVER